MPSVRDDRSFQRPVASVDRSDYSNGSSSSRHFLNGHDHDEKRWSSHKASPWDSDKERKDVPYDRHRHENEQNGFGYVERRMRHRRDEHDDGDNGSLSLEKKYEKDYAKSEARHYDEDRRYRDERNSRSSRYDHRFEDKAYKADRPTGPEADYPRNRYSDNYDLQRFRKGTESHVSSSARATNGDGRHYDTGLSRLKVNADDDDDDDAMQRLWRQEKERKKRPSDDGSIRANDKSATHAVNASQDMEKDVKEHVGIASSKALVSPNTSPENRNLHHLENQGAPSSHSPPRAKSPAEPLTFPPDANKKSAPLTDPHGDDEILLPHQLMLPENEAKLPKATNGKTILPFRLACDPVLDKTKTKGEMIKFLNTKAVSDPRTKVTKRKPRSRFHLLNWKWDENSTKPKPPPPPKALVISGLSTLTTSQQLIQHFRVFGRIEETELKMNPSSGASLGIFYIRFAHDYDEDMHLLPDASQSRAQRADLVVKEAKAKTDGQRVGTQNVNVILDDADRTNFIKTYRDELEKQRLGKQKAEAAQKSARHDDVLPDRMHASVVSKGSASLTTPHPRISSLQGRSPFRHHSPGTPPYRETPSDYDRRDRNRRHHRTDEEDIDGSSDEEDFNRRRSLSSRVFYGTSQSHRHPHRSVSMRRADEKQEETHDVLRELISLGRPYLFVSYLKSSSITSTDVGLFFEEFDPEFVKCDTLGWYVAFRSQDAASRCQMVLRDKSLHGFRLKIELRSIHDAKQALKPEDRTSETSHDEGSIERSPKRVVSEKNDWTEAELLDDCRTLLLRELGPIFMRDLRTRVIKPFLSEFLQSDKTGGSILHDSIKSREEDLEDLDLRVDVDRPKTFNRAAREEERRKRLEMEKERELAELRVREGYKQPEEEESRVKLVDGGAKHSGLKSRKSKELVRDELDSKLGKLKKTRPASPQPDPFAIGLTQDEEDLYFARLALEAMQKGDSHAASRYDVLKEKQEESDLSAHSSGAAKTEGFYRIPPAEKALHLPDRNRAVVDLNSSAGLASARDNRADSRRFVQGIEQHKKEMATDTDILKFNQLRSRKKQLKFAKSPIHDWGLYAMELIPTGDMVIEYVGEIVRQQIADEREKMYERQGNFSTYLFRVDDDIVVDATKKGNIARLMNHCCTPNCNAKILTLNGEKRIVLYAKEPILPGQELTYDYKFQATGNEEDAIACLCGSPGCRRFL